MVSAIEGTPDSVMCGMVGNAEIWTQFDPLASWRDFAGTYSP